MLEYDPAKRITLDEALEHNFFDALEDWLNSVELILLQGDYTDCVSQQLVWNFVNKLFCIVDAVNISILFYWSYVPLNC